MNKKLYLALCSLGVLTLSIGYISLHPVEAQAPIRAYTMKPPSVTVSGDPGKTSEGTIKFVNENEITITVEANIRDYIVEDNRGTPRILPPDSMESKYAAASWIDINPTKFTLAPHATQELNYYVQIPQDGRPGGRYAAVVYEPVGKGGVKGAGTEVNAQLGTLFYITVNGPISENAKITQFKSNGFQEYGPITMTTEIQNLSDIHIKPKGTITVKDMFGKTVATNPLEDPMKEHFIFPGKSFLYSNTFGKGFMIGKYTATFAGTYGTGNLPLSATFTLWVFPWKIAMMIVLAIVFAILILMVIQRKRSKKTQAPQQ